MTITEIVPVTSQRFRVVTDEGLAFVLYKGELSRYGLKEGAQLPEQAFAEIYREILAKRAKLRAMHLLTRSDQSEAELRRKLKRGEYTDMAVEEAIAYVKSYHYLDDARYAASYLSYAAGKKSRRQAEAELLRKGISRDIIQSCRRQETDGGDAVWDETELIRALLEKRCREPERADEKEKRRLYAYMARRGFQGTDISRVFREYFRDFQDEFTESSWDSER